MCRRKSILIKTLFKIPKSKERLGLKNKGFLTILFFLSYNQKLDGTKIESLLMNLPVSEVSIISE